MKIILFGNNNPIIVPEAEKNTMITNICRVIMQNYYNKKNKQFIMRLN